MWTIILIGIGALVIYLIAVTNQRREEWEARIEEQVKKQKDFTPTKIVRNGKSMYFPYYYFAVDTARQEMFFLSPTQEIRFHYRNIVMANMQVNNDVTETHKSASLGGAVVGGVLGGGLGAVVGGSSMGTSTSVSKATKISVHILLRNMDVNSINVECLVSGDGLQTWTNEYKEAYSNAQSIFDISRLAIDEIDLGVKNVAAQNSSIEGLKELANLRSQGLITEEEFSVMKAKIINK